MVSRWMIFFKNAHGDQEMWMMSLKDVGAYEVRNGLVLPVGVVITSSIRWQGGVTANVVSLRILVDGCRFSLQKKTWEKALKNIRFFEGNFPKKIGQRPCPPIIEISVEIKLWCHVTPPQKLQCLDFTGKFGKYCKSPQLFVTTWKQHMFSWFS